MVLAPAAVVALLTVGLAACGGGSGSGGGGSGGGDGGTLKGAYTAFPDYMDPQLSFAVSGWTAMRPVYIALLTYKHEAGPAGTEIIPGLAKALPKVTNGGKTYTLFLRKGLKYSNGEPVKAGDFKFAVERCFLLNSGGSPFYTSIVGARQFAKTKKGGISGIKVNEKSGEIVIDLERPRGTFEAELAIPFTSPVPQSTPESDQSASPPPATGPYVITQSKPGRGWDYERNPYWAKNNAKLMPEIPSGHVDKIEIEVLRNQSTQVNDIESGALDWIRDPPPADRYQEVKEKYEGTQFRPQPTNSTYYFWMNTQKAPFDDLKVRQAVNYAVDPAALERIYAGQIKGTQQILPPGLPGYKKFQLYPHNMTKAKELIEEANPSDKEITVWTNSESPNNQAGTYYAGVLEELGFDVELKILTSDNFEAVIGNKNTMNLDTGWEDWFEDYPHPSDFFGPLLDGNNIRPLNNQNFSQFDNPAINAKIKKLSEEQLGSKQEAEYAELDEEVMKEAPWVPFGTRTQSTFVSSAVNLDSVVWTPIFEDDLATFELNK